MLEAEWLTAREAQQHAAVAVLVCQSVLEIVEADAEKLQTPEAIEAASRERNGLQAAERELADSTTAAEVLATEAAAAKSRAAAATSSASFATRLASKAESEKAATAAAAAVAAAAATAAVAAVVVVVVGMIPAAAAVPPAPSCLLTRTLTMAVTVAKLRAR